MSNFFFTSDIHFGHENIWKKFCPASRDWCHSTEEMDEGLIERWNAKVAPNDTVYNHGDFFFYNDFERLCSYLKRLNGHQIFMFGNHDKWLRNQMGRLVTERLALVGAGSKIVTCQDYLEHKVAGNKIRSFHYPLAVWEGNHRGTWNTYGHCHGSFTAVGKQLDVGFDSHDFDGFGYERGPWSIEEVAAVMNSREIVCPDHHTVATANR